MSYLIIGGGQAGLSAVAKLRELDSTTPIDLLCAEPTLPYQRPPLSKAFLSGTTTLDRLHLRPENWFSENNIKVHLSTIANSIDRKSKSVETNNATFIYEKLLIATGSFPRTLSQTQGGNLAGVHTLRSFQDAESLKQDLETSKKLVIIGGGYIGLEVAAKTRQMNIEVEILELSPRILQRVACSETSDYFRTLHKSHGVKFRESTSFKTLEGEGGRVSSVMLEDGESLPTDLVLCGIGILPETSLAEQSGLTTDNNDGGIVIDEHCTTSDSSIFAAGDCANYTRRIESVPNAIYQGELSAHSMTSTKDSKIFVPWFWSDQYDIKLQIAGINEGYTRTLVRPSDKGDGRSIWYFSNETFLSIDSMNDASSFMMARKYLESGIKPCFSDIESTIASGIPLKDLDLS